MRRWILWVVLAAAVLFTLNMLAAVPITPAPDGVNLPWSYVVLLSLRDAQLWLTRVDWMTVFAAILIVGTIVIFGRLTGSKTNSFDISDAFAGENGKTSMSKIFLFMGGLTCIWMMPALLLAGKMTEGYFGLFIAGVVLQKGITEATGVLRQSQIARTVEARAGVPETDPAPAKMELAMSMSSDAPPTRKTAAPTVRRPLGKA